MRKTRLRVRLKYMTWIITERASMTKRPPMMMLKSSVLVMTAIAAKAVPRASDPVSPMKIPAG